MADPTPAEKSEMWDSVAEQFADAFIGAIFKTDIGKRVTAEVTDGLGAILGLVFTLLSPIGVGLAKGIATAEDIVAPALSEIAAAAVSDVFGTNIPASAFASKRNSGGRKGASDALGAGLINTIKGAGSSLQPSDDAAKRYLTMVINMALEGWYQGWMFEFMSSLVPQFDVGKIESFAQLDDTIAQTLGLGRITRSVLRPITDATVVTPLRWQTNKTYRPELLTASEVARQVARGRWTREKGIEELARQGYSDDRIEALLNAQRKAFSAGDVRTFVNREYWTKEQGIAHLKDQGYTEQEALDALRLEGLRRFEQLEDQEAGAIVTAYAQREIDRSTMLALLNDAVTNASERALWTELAEVRRVTNVRRVTSAQVATMVRAGVLSVIDYRRALEREGYPPEDVIALELVLRYDMDRARDIEEHRRDLEEQRAAEQRRREEERAIRQRAIEAEREQARRGPLAPLEDAAIRGLIPLSRVEELYAYDYDGETVAILMDRLEERRAEYVAQQAAREEAIKRGQRRNLSVAQLETAVLIDVLTIDQYRGAIAEMGFDAGDVEILASTLSAKKTARDAAIAHRLAAADEARRRSIDLGRFERLVRRGLRTRAQYAALLAELGFDDGSVAAMGELLDAEIADDARARALREAAELALRSRGLSLEQLRRGVLLGVRTVTDFRTFLMDQGYTVDAQEVLTAELRADLADAEAARARRDAEGGAVGARALPLSTVRRAARLGVIAPDTYAARLQADGYSEEDIAIDLDLLLLEIADVQARRAARAAAIAARESRGLTVAQVERGVKAGTATIDDYRAAAATAGYSVDATDELVELLELELESLADGRARRDTIAGELATRGLSLAQLEESVRKDLQTLDDFYAELSRLGYGAEDAELLTTMLAIDLDAKAAG